ncbi:putative transposase [Nitrosospira sp. Nsp11]|nr:putative transposase [Nitrosospira sp. Nsp11]
MVEKADSASLLMKHLGQRYVQYVNRTYRRNGTLWEGRFCSCLTQTEDYLLACYLYIELNPVRAGMVRHPCDYRWSSYAANAEGRPNRLIRPHYQYLCLAQSDTQRCIAYRDLFKTDLDADVLSQIRDSTNGNFVLGAERFQKKLNPHSTNVPHAARRAGPQGQ